jgi:MoxR-vWA-beta-propeller ternary system domain bpX4
MSLHLFLRDLEENGRVKVAPPEDTAIPNTDDAVADELREFDRHARLEMAFEAPPFREVPALWAASKLYRACQLFVFREPDDATQRALVEPCPERVSPSVSYSVDLSLRFLPDVVTLVRAASGVNALLSELLRLAREWPLSSVGIQSLDVSTCDIEYFLDHPGLRQLYVDRIIARRDVPRATHATVRDGIRQAVGLFPALAPSFAATLQTTESAP